MPQELSCYIDCFKHIQQILPRIKALIELSRNLMQVKRLTTVNQIQKYTQILVHVNK